MNQSIEKLLKDRYFLKEEKTWSDISKRIGKGTKIEEYINNFEFIPSSPTLMNYNTNGERRGTLSSCFPMNIEDSIDGIFDSLKESAITTKMGGGVGYDFSVLRSSGENVNTINRESSGPVPFINIFNSMLDGIQQGGVRRGAGMAMLSVNHPDILKFINAKKDLNKINRFNFSIKMNNKFYEQLEKNPDSNWFVKNRSNDLEFALQDKNGKLITVKELWELIIDNAWDVAEPGVFNEDIAFERCTVTNISKQVLSNPCLKDDAILITKNGLKRLKDICENDFIWSETGWTKVIKKWKTGEKEVFRYYTTSGNFESTENHEIISNGIKLPIKDAESIDTLIGEYEKRNKIILNYVMDGLVLGDGSIHKASNNLIFLNIGKDDYDYFDSEISNYILRDRTKSFKTGWEIKTSITIEELVKTYNRFIPERFFNLNKDELYSLLRGLFSANGSICGNRITYKTSSFNMIKDLQIILSYLGIRSYYTTNKSLKNKFRNGDYVCKQSYDLNISIDRNKFYESIGFIQKYKMNKLEKLLNKKRSKIKTNFNIVKKESIGIFDVYDITVDNNTHTFWCNGFNISNCQEFVNIPYSSCNLGSINLAKLVENGKFNWTKFKEIIIAATYFLDNIIDENNYPIPKIEEITKKIRPIGLGIMGLAHAFYLKGISYNSKKAEDLSKEIITYMTLISMQTSIEIAKDRCKSYDAFDYDLFIKANERFFKSNCREINVQQLKEDIKTYGINNSCFTSIAPTGSIATIAEASTGIEPVFALTYMRKVEKLNNEYDIMYITDPIFQKYLDDNFDEKKKIKILQEISENKGSCQNCKDISDNMKEIFVVASDISPMQHLKVLGAIANATSLSVSKTINLPADIDKEAVSEVFLNAYKMGIIGVTVYRDGSRDGILVHKDVMKEIVTPERPNSLPCHVYKITVSGEKWIVFIGVLDNRPFEIFAGKINLVDIPSNISEGIITKSGGVYQFEYNGEVIIKDIAKLFENETHEALTRMISMALRRGMEINNIVHQLQKSKGSIVDFSKSILRALKKYIKDGEKSGSKCKNCGETLIYIGGCLECPAKCGYAECG